MTLMTEKNKIHLWEVEHNYYCTNTNYFTNEDTTCKYKSWNEFLVDWDNADKDYNLLFRWDWEIENKNEDDSYRDGVLYLFFILQRKGYIITCLIDVCRNDEVKIIEFLKPYHQHLKELWMPIYD